LVAHAYFTSWAVAVPERERKKAGVQWSSEKKRKENMKERRGIPSEIKAVPFCPLFKHRPAWPELAQWKLDEAVFSAYGWDPGMSDDDILSGLLTLNMEREA
jgi:hypothetical protein